MFLLHFYIKYFTHFFVSGVGVIVEQILVWRSTLSVDSSILDDKIQLAEKKRKYSIDINLKYMSNI